MQTNATRHKEITAHLRKCIKAEGIEARVKMQDGNGGEKYIVVAVPFYEERFTSEEIHKFCVAAKANKLTFVRSVEIDPFHEEQLTEKQQWDFYL